MVHNNMLFSKRMELANEAEDWCRRSHIKPDSFNVITALSAMGYVIVNEIVRWDRESDHLTIVEILNKLPDPAIHDSDIIEWILPPRNPFYDNRDAVCEEVQRIVKFCKSTNGKQWVYLGFKGED